MNVESNEIPERVLQDEREDDVDAVQTTSSILYRIDRRSGSSRAARHVVLLVVRLVETKQPSRDDAEKTSA